MTDIDDTIAPDSEPIEAKSRVRWLKWALLGVVAIVAVGFAGIFFYANVLNNSPDALDESDLSAALGAADTTAPTETTSADTAPSDTAVPAQTPAPTDGASVPAPSFDGDWVPTEASEFGYRVEEVLAGVNTSAVGRSNQIGGLLTIDGTTATVVAIEVPVDTIKSDSSLRDNKFAGDIMNTADFPTAQFTLTEPIEFGTIPTGDEQVTATATGELTLRGVTNTVTFEVTAQTTGGRVGVLGSIPVVFADYGIDNPSFGQVKTEDDGLIEFVLVFEPAA